MKYLEVTFADKEEFGVTSRVLQTETDLSNQEVTKFYEPYCEKEGVHIFDILPRTKEEIQRWNDREPLNMDTYSEKHLENECHELSDF